MNRKIQKYDGIARQIKKFCSFFTSKPKSQKFNFKKNSNSSKIENSRVLSFQTSGNVLESSKKCYSNRFLQKQKFKFNFEKKIIFFFKSIFRLIS